MAALLLVPSTLMVVLVPVPVLRQHLEFFPLALRRSGRGLRPFVFSFPFNLLFGVVVAVVVELPFLGSVSLSVPISVVALLASVVALLASVVALLSLVVHRLALFALFAVVAVVLARV